MRQVERLAKATSTPLGYFFLDAPPKERLGIPHFRTLGDRDLRPPSPDLLETVHTMERRQAWMREYLVEQGDEPLSFVHSAKIADPPENTAEKIREALELSAGWASGQNTWTDALTELRHLIKQAGILVAVSGIVGNNTHRKLDPNEFRGFVLVDDYAPLVFINGADFKAAQMFTLAHELAHIWLGSSAAFDLRDLQPAPDTIEQACNRVAAEFLVPSGEIQGLWPGIQHLDDPFQSVAHHFKVSVIVAARRALDLGLITTHRFKEFYENYLQSERHKNAVRGEGGNFYAMQNLRLGRRFSEAVMRATAEGFLPYYEAYQLTALYGKPSRNTRRGSTWELADERRSKVRP